MVTANALLITRTGALIGTLLLSSCLPTEAPPAGEADRRALLAVVVDEVLLPGVAEFSAATEALTLAARAHEAAGGGVGPTQDDARAAWRAAMASWQRLAVLQLGPGGSPVTFTGGQGLRDLIDAWPQVNACGVDQQLVLGTFTDEGWGAARLVNVLGLGSMEYALFVDGEQNACPAAAAINRDGQWAALSPAEIVSRRAAYARVLAEEVEAHAQTLATAWATFGPDLKKAGEGGSSFSTAQAALDELYAALFYVELVTKDKKLAVPAGLHVDCAAVTCPEMLESRYSRTSRDNITQNLASLRRVFLGIDRNGADKPGFDDLLRARDASDVAQTMTTRLGAAIAAAEAFDGSVEDALESPEPIEHARVHAVYDVLKLFTDDFKSVFPSTLGLRVPDEGAGDND